MFTAYTATGMYRKYTNTQPLELFRPLLAAMSVQVLHCLPTGYTFETWIKLKITSLQTLNSKWICPVDKGGTFYDALLG